MRIDSLTTLRFVAALIVVIFHFGREATGWTGFLVSGPQMVTFFFVLSGFVMAIAYGKRESVGLGQYLWARFARIYPIYLAALLLVLVSRLMRGVEIGPLALGLNLTLLQSWIPPFPTSLNSPGWSLSVEAFFYVSFPFLLVALKRCQSSPQRLLAVGLVGWLVTQAVLSGALMSDLHAQHPEMVHDVVYYNPLAHVCSFVLGIVGGLLFVERKLFRSSGVGAFVIAGLSGWGIVAGLNHPDVLEAAFGVPLAFGASFFAPLFLVFIISIAASRWGWSDWLAKRPFVVLGEASYSLYILQVPLYQAYTQFLKPRLGLSGPADFWTYVALLIGASIASFYWIERPANRFLRARYPFGARVEA